MRPLVFAALSSLAIAAGSAATAGPRSVVLLELYTSQGCSSCPPADALLEQLAGRDDVLALALHVDYWDYIGWADSFARPENTTRQRAYAHAMGESTIYTPQMVVGGTDTVVGYRPMQVADLLAAHRADMGQVALSAEADGTSLKITAHPAGGATLPGAMLVDLVRYQPSATVKITHGENAGETITYANIVTSWDHLGRWDGKSDFAMTAEVPSEGRLAVIVQAKGPGRVYAAMRVR